MQMSKLYHTIRNIRIGKSYAGNQSAQLMLARMFAKQMSSKMTPKRQNIGN